MTLREEASTERDAKGGWTGQAGETLPRGVAHTAIATACATVHARRPIAIRTTLQCEREGETGRGGDGKPGLPRIRQSVS